MVLLASIYAYRPPFPTLFWLFCPLHLPALSNLGSNSSTLSQCCAALHYLQRYWVSGQTALAQPPHLHCLPTHPNTENWRMLPVSVCIFRMARCPLRWDNEGTATVLQRAGLQNHCFSSVSSTQATCGHNCPSLALL